MDAIPLFYLTIGKLICKRLVKAFAHVTLHNTSAHCPADRLIDKKWNNASFPGDCDLFALLKVGSHAFQIFLGNLLNRISVQRIKNNNCMESIYKSLGEVQDRKRPNLILG